MAPRLRHCAAWAPLAALAAAPKAGAAIVEKCLPAWATLGPDGSVNGTCPYGHALPGDISWSARLYAKSPLELYLALFWSYVPWLLVALLAMETLLTRGTRALQFAGFAGIIVGLNEFVWKHLVHQQRPVGSCLLDCGMPSSHAMISIGLATLFLLDLAFRVCPTDVEVLRLRQEDPAEHRLWRRARALASLLRPSRGQAVSNGQFVLAAGAWLLLLGPVPASRVYLRDHSASQVAVGACIGLLEAVLWFAMVRHLSWTYRGSLGARWPSDGRHVLRHDCAVPCHELLAQHLLEDPVAARRVLDGTPPSEQCPAPAAAKAPAPMPLLVGVGRECGVMAPAGGSR